MSVPVTFSAPIALVPEGQIARCLYLETFEDLERKLVANYVKPGMTVIDIGANVGLYSLLADKRMRLSGQVWAIEPSQESFERLLKNIALNSATLVHPLKVALSAADDTSVLLLREPGQQDGERYLLPRGGTPIVEESEHVATLTLDTMCQRHGIGSVDLIKMDVEGGEYDVFRGASLTLRRNPDMIAVFEHTREGCQRAGVTPRDISRLLEEFGFQLFAWNSKARQWDGSHSYILDQGNAWAARDVKLLPRI